MATVTGRLTINGVQYLEVDADPSAAATPAPVGSVATVDDGSGLYLKTGAGDTAWTLLDTGAVSGSGANDRVAVWNGTGSLDSSVALTFDGSLFTVSTRVKVNTSGTQALPALYFSTETSTGLWRKAANTLAFSSGGVEMITINPFGAVTINELGDATPDFRVETSGDSSAFLVDNSAEEVVVGSGGVDFRVRTSASTHALFVNASANEVVIGDDSTDPDFRVEGAIGAGAALTHFFFVDASASRVFVNGNTGTSNFNVNGTVNLDGSVIINSGQSTGGDLRVDGSSATHLLFVDVSTSRIGINQSSPGSLLHITSGNAPVFWSERTTANTAAPYSAGRFELTSTGNMVDGFGPAVLFAVSDTGIGTTDIAHVSGVRDGADNTGALLFTVYSAGVSRQMMKVRDTEVDYYQDDGATLMARFNASGTPGLFISNNGTVSGTTFGLAYTGFSYNVNSAARGAICFSHRGTGDKTCVEILFNAETAAGVNDEWIIFRDQNGELGKIHSTVTYGTFTGAHEGQSTVDGVIRTDITTLDGSDVCYEVGGRVWEPGMIVVSNGTPITTHIGRALVGLDLADTTKDKRVMGVFTFVEDEHDASGFDKDKDLITYHALGEGMILVCDAAGDIGCGDYVTTCTVPGYGALQDDDVLHSYTVAKITQDIDWTAVTDTVEHAGVVYKRALVTCTYHCG